MKSTGLVFRGMVLTALFLLAVIVISEHSAFPSLGSSSSHAIYTSVKISSGDSLTSIAETYNTGSGMDNEEYISAVRSLNSMSGEKLHPGCYLTVIWYDEGNRWREWNQ